MIKCTFCEKYCGNAGSLKLHIRAKHKDIHERTENDAEKTTVEAAGLIERNDVSHEKTLKNSKAKNKGVNKSALTSVEAGKNRNEENNSAQEKSRQNPKSVNNASITQEKTGNKSINYLL